MKIRSPEEEDDGEGDPGGHRAPELVASRDARAFAKLPADLQQVIAERENERTRHSTGK